MRSRRSTTASIISSNFDHAPDRASLRFQMVTFGMAGRTRPHLYRLMFTTPAGDPTAAVRAAGRTWDLFLDIVGRIVGPQRARHYDAGQGAPIRSNWTRQSTWSESLALFWPYRNATVAAPWAQALACSRRASPAPSHLIRNVYR